MFLNLIDMTEDQDEIQDITLRLKSSLPICRICLDVSMECIEFDSPLCLINGEEITYSDAFQEVSSFVHDLPDKIPTYLCSTCGNDLLNTYLFLKRIENTNFILEKVKHLEFKNADKAEANVTCIGVDPLVETLKVEVVNHRISPKCADLLPSIKLDNQSESTECHIQDEYRNEISLKTRAICAGNFMDNSPCDEEWFGDDPNSEICDTEKISENDSVRFCLRCDQKFTSENELRHHILSHDHSIEDRQKQKPHLRTYPNVHKDRKGCKAYQKKLNSKSRQWLSRRNVEEKSTKYVDLKVKADELKNPKIIEQNETSNLICNLCGRKCLTAIGLKSHSRVHKERKFVCHVCSKMCSTESTLKRHIDHIHMSDCKKYQCEDCGLVFKYPSYLRDHQRKHDAENKYKCPFCDRSYCRKPQYDIHLRYHYNDYRYKCSYCSKGYATKSNLTDHIKSSHIKITYDCDKCDQKFKSVTGLKKHKYSHTGYPYNCPLCLLGQATRSGIKTHIFGVHKDAITMDEFNKMFPLVNPKSGYRRPKAKSIE